jgi:hypothetical protein
MEMEQMMACLLAERKTNQERMKAKIDANRKAFREETQAMLERTMAKLDAHHGRAMAC